MATSGRVAASAVAAAAATVAFFWGSGLKTGENERNVRYVAEHGRRSTSSLAPVVIDPRARFLRYAKHDADNREVLDAAGFVACACLLNDEDWQSLAKDVERPTAVHAHSIIEHLFYLIGVDHRRAITYEQFCVLMTLLSTRRKQMQLAFGVFDDNEDSRLSKHEFLDLLNGLMVDPNVRIVQNRLSENQRLPSSWTACGRSSAPGPASNGEMKSHSSGKFAVENEALPVLPLAEPLFGLTGEDTVSFDEVWSALCEIRHKIRALVFGLYDPRNTGEIRLQDFRWIVSRSAGENENGGVGGRGGGTNKWADKGGKLISCDFYLKLLDVFFECDEISHRMNLAVKAKLPSQQQQGQKEETKRAKEGATGSETLLTSFATRNPVDFELDSAELHHVLEVSPGFSHLTKCDVEQMIQLFDVDRSGMLSPMEFAQMCQLAACFFIPRRPRFNVPKGNTLQNFILCMQQLK